jgi:hypothetical protein
MMRALTLTQPWAGLVASGIKLIENRPRHMIKREDFGKPFAIHASREIDERVYDLITERAPELVQMPGVPWWQLSRITSAVISIATIEQVFDPNAHGIGTAEPAATAPMPADQRRWFFGPIGYLLRDVRALAKPVPCRGWQGFWTLAPHLETLVREQLEGAAA